MNVISLAIMLSFTFAMPYADATRLPSTPGICENILNSNSFIYVQGTASARKLLRLTGKQYKSLAQTEDIPSDSILLVDELPLDVDLPKVEGVIVSTPLTVEGTHIQLQAEKMNMPLVYIASAYGSLDLQAMAASGRYVWISTLGRPALKFMDQPFPGYGKNRMRSVLPASVRRNVMKIVGPSHPDDSLELYGAKYASLRRFVGLQGHLEIPTIFSATSGYFEHFLDEVRVGQLSLRSFIKHQEELMALTVDPTEVKSRLEAIRSAILTSEANGVFNLFYESFSKVAGFLWKGKKQIWSIRSNNEIEDYLSAGLFQSTVADANSPQEIELALRKLWSSLYTYRAYQIGNYWGIQRANLSMPVLLHPYVGKVRLHATGSFSVVRDLLVLRLNIVMGDSNQATNPKSNLNVINLVISSLSKSNPRVFGDRVALGNSNLTALIQTFTELYNTVKDDFNTVRVPPKSIGIEMVVDDDFTPVLLQYTKRPTRETVLELLSGGIAPTDLDLPLRRLLNSSLGEITKALSKFKINFLSHISMVHFEADYATAKKAALIRVGDVPRLIAWDFIFHETVEGQLQILDSGLTWINGLYLKKKEHTLIIQSNSYFESVSPTLLKQALVNEINVNPEAFYGISKFEIHDGQEQTIETLDIEVPVTEKPFWAR